MLSRGRSKERERKVTPPGPVYMSNTEFGEYLKNLRENRVSRPAGARPPPPSTRRESDRVPVHKSVEETADLSHDPVPRSASAMSHTHAQPFAFPSVASRTGRQLVQPPVSTTAAILKPSEVVPSATYMERGQRWMEKEEAVSLREAMEDMGLKSLDEEARIHEAAQKEASEIVWQHEYPGAPSKPEGPYRYKDHLRKNSYQHARTQSVGRYGAIGRTTGLARDMAPRTVSNGSSSSGGGEMHSPKDRSSGEFPAATNIRAEPAPRQSTDSSRPPKLYGSMGKRTSSVGNRKTSLKRNISGEVSGTFTGEQIWEEPEQESLERRRSQEGRDQPAPLRLKAKNPLNRVQFAQDPIPRSNSTPPEPTKRLSTSEIYRNPPSQSRNPFYVANPSPVSSPKFSEKEAPAVPMKDGLEIRSEEIRKATSMSLKDRSPKLPTPTAVSDKAGRPIVSFDKNWKPKEEEADAKPVRRSPFDRRFNGQSLPQGADSAPVPIVQLAESPSVEVRSAPTIAVPAVNLPRSNPSGPTINFSESRPTIPTINLPNARPSIPTINVPTSTPAVPTINFPEPPSISVSTPDVPTISVRPAETQQRPPPPQISISAPVIPTINVGSSGTQSRRPLPDPGSAASRRPFPASRGHWSPAAGRRATATCHQCQLPIEGRVVKLGGASEHFHPECFICFGCGTGLESLEIHPEPASSRAERIDRIQRRARGEEIPEVEGQTFAEDGDEKMRYYCHLDFHENFAPKCKHCKTPIIGEHTVALGEHWHYGHFFCAECGDPFEKGMTHIEKDGYAWCLNCQTKRTERQAPKCKKCKKPVIGEYVQALGGEWHDRCFRCASCNHGFDDGAFYPKQVGSETVVLCIQCIERELKA